MDRDRLPSTRRREWLRLRRLKRREQVKREARAQGGPDDMHDDPARENRLLFDACDDVIREPDAIRGARELEVEAIREERRVHRDRDMEAIDDVRELDRQDFDVV